MHEELNNLIQSLKISDEDRNFLIKEFKDINKKNVVLEFKYNRTLIDKAAITNILNASIAEIEKQKEIIEKSKIELNKTLIEVNSQRKLIEDKNKKLKKLLYELQQTQKQLIHSEKMASLGELTAGIAHEIQNPLNFVNNFSELSNELLDEMSEELDTGNIKGAKEIANDVIQNLKKINHHGKRADAIVKAMLQHSRKSTAVKEPTDINKLADEYLQLAYHGLRAKDKNFNATLEKDYDKSINKINIIPQDMGRVILNVINNAFYAVSTQTFKGGTKNSSYKPTVSVSTKQIPHLPGAKGKIIISVKDNGNGIPKNVLQKIFQPFFTTKPTGQGTGLGLSMSYDIIKAHGGELKVESTEGKGTECTIVLPIN